MKEHDRWGRGGPHGREYDDRDREWDRRSDREWNLSMKDPRNRGPYGRRD